MNRLKFLAKVLLTVSLIMLTILIVNNNEKAQQVTRERATWLWHTEEIAKDADQIIAFLVKNNVKDLYLQVNYDLELNNYKSFIEKAFVNNINVHALEGGPEWATQAGVDMQQMFFDWVALYQNEVSENQQFRGIHLDIEPYLNEQYHSNTGRNIEYYQNCLADALSQSESLGLSLSVSIPFWFDEVEYATGYGEGILAEWIISNVKNVVIMAYRDKALGDNGIIKLASTEIELAKRYDAVIIIGVETQQADEGNNTSFYEEGQRHMNKELKRVYKRYGNDAGFGGFAIHHLMSWIEIEK